MLRKLLCNEQIKQRNVRKFTNLGDEEIGGFRLYCIIGGLYWNFFVEILFLWNFSQFSAFRLICGSSIVGYPQIHVLEELSKHWTNSQIPEIEPCDDSAICVCFEFHSVLCSEQNSRFSEGYARKNKMISMPIHVALTYDKNSDWSLHYTSVW